MRFRSVALKNNMILILSLTPFIISLVFSIYKSSDTEYLSLALNISGSQRMRTMLLSNYSQGYVKASEDGNLEGISEYRELLLEEADRYFVYYEALMYGDEELDMKENPFTDIFIELDGMSPLVMEYRDSVGRLIADPKDNEALLFVIHNAMSIKNGFHLVTNMYQDENDAYIKTKRDIDTVMLVFAACITMLGLLLSTSIKRHEYEANHDHLTGLKNRQNFYNMIEKESPEDYSIVFIDINHFKQINDLYGHDIGDEILKQVSDRMLRVFDRNHLFRYGGDEFIGLIKHKEVADNGHQYRIGKDIEKLVTNVRRAFEEPIKDSKTAFHHVDFAMGIISKEVELDDWEIIVSASDRLMYMAKEKEVEVLICHEKEDIDKYFD